MAPSYEQNTTKSCKIHGTMNLQFKWPVHEAYAHHALEHSMPRGISVFLCASACNGGAGGHHKGVHATRNHQGARHARVRPRERWGACAPRLGQCGGEAHGGPPGRRMEGWKQGCIRREGTSQAAPQAVRQAVGGGCQSCSGRLMSVTNTIEAGTWRSGDSGWVLVVLFPHERSPALGPIYGHGDTLHCQKAPYVWAWEHFALPKSALCMGMGTRCTAKQPPVYVYGDTLPKILLCWFLWGSFYSFGCPLPLRTHVINHTPRRVSVSVWPNTSTQGCIGRRKSYPPPLQVAQPMQHR